MSHVLAISGLYLDTLVWFLTEVLTGTFILVYNPTTTTETPIRHPYQDPLYESCDLGKLELSFAKICLSVSILDLKLVEHSLSGWNFSNQRLAASNEHTWPSLRPERSGTFRSWHSSFNLTKDGADPALLELYRPSGKWSW